MADQDVFDATVFATGSFSSDVTVSGGTAVVNTVDAFGTATLTGAVAQPNDTLAITFDDGAGDTYDFELAAVFDYAGGIVLQDGTGNYWLFSQAPLQAGDSVAAASGFGHDDPSTSTTACYVEGTRIATDRGPVPVERLRLGDRVQTARGHGYAPVIWPGRRQVRCAAHPRPHEVWPVRIAAGAFGVGQPVRDLWVSPGHALHIDGALVPAGALLNGATITQPPRERVRYHHFELPTHDVVLAEGLAAESYVDAGNRDSFVDSGTVVAAFPDFEPHREGVERCAPWLHETLSLAPLRARLRARAGALGHHDTDDPGLRVEVPGGAVLRPEARPGGPGLVATVPPGVAALRLVSLTAVPAEQPEGGGDRRRLGVAVGRILLDGVELRLDDPRLGIGWHEAEPGHRWTAGRAAVALESRPRPQRLEIALLPMLRYWQPATPLRRRHHM